MTISHMTRCPSLKPWMLAAGTSQLMIAKGGSDIPSGFIPGASPWIISDAMLMKTCGLTLKIAEIRYSHFVGFFLVPPIFILAFCCCFFVQNALLSFMKISFTVSNTVKLVLFYHIVNSISIVPPVENSNGKKNRFAFYWNAFECEHYMWTYSSKPIN